MIARGAAALFAHLVHYRQGRFLWAISPTGDKCETCFSNEKGWGSPSPEQILGAEALSILLLVLLTGAGMETCLASSAFGILRGCLTHLTQSGWGWADRPRALVPGSALPSTSQKGSIDLLALPRMLPKCTSSPNSTSHRLCRSGFQPWFPHNSEQ